MTTCILFFRDVNVGGGNELPMAGLVGMLDSLGVPGAVTYKQSGNVAVRCSRQQAASLGWRIKAAVQESHGFEPSVLVLKIQEVEHAIAVNPFREAAREPKALYLWFLAAEPTQPDFKTLDELKLDSERYKLDKKAFYLHAPDGIDESRLAEGVENCLGVEAIVRDWRTVSKILETAWQLS
jgi:uncharacterized protein (DUF1697 family)